jgi:Response regulator containing CheY-like receiver domain and AraC-type DNA-binding domain
MFRLLVIDDEWLLRQGIIRMVERLCSDWLIEEAGNGQEAIARLGQSSFDLILSDIKMPLMDGISMLNELTKQGCRVPVVFLTGFDDFPLIQNALRLRAYDYLLKPVRDEDILKVFESFKKDFYRIKVRSESAQAQLRQFEFQLMNALESFDSERVASVVEEGQSTLGQAMPLTQYVDEIIRISNHFFSKYRLFGFDKELNMSSNDLSNLANIRHAIHLRFTYMKESETEMKGGNKTIKLAKAYIESHLHQSLTLAEVAEFVHFNPTYFSEYFKEKSGETFMQFVTRMKIEKAKELLSDPTVKINDISDNLGYSDPRSFTKMFKMVLGLTPTEYRNQQQ